LLSAGYEISIDNGAEENELNNSRDENEIMRSLFACDEEVLIVRRVGEREDTPATRGFVRLVYGNSPEEVVCDYSMNLDAIVGGPRSEHPASWYVAHIAAVRHALRNA
jgi:hypothetical protein